MVGGGWCRDAFCVDDGRRRDGKLTIISGEARMRAAYGLCRVRPPHLHMWLIAGMMLVID